MSRHTEIAQRAWEAFSVAVETGDFDDFCREFLDPAFEYKPLEESETIRGHDAYIRYVRRWLEVWEHIEWDIEELSDAGDEVVARIRMAGRGKKSGIDVEMRYFSVGAVRDGKIVRSIEYLDRAAAFKAAGLPAEDRA
jgi:ketosteroid isomerase-like protein